MSLDDPIVAEVLADLAPAVQPAPAATGLPSRFACFVTGTDTEIGKTLTSSALLHALVARVVRACGMNRSPPAPRCATASCIMKTPTA